MSHGGSKKVVLFALLANGGIAAAKFAAALATGSGAMMAEAIHSFADCGNQLLLLLGAARATKAPTVEHPLGYGREAYFWGMLVAGLLFTLGGVFSVYEGVHKLAHPEPLAVVTIPVPGSRAEMTAVPEDSVSMRLRSPGGLSAFAAAMPPLARSARTTTFFEPPWDMGRAV